LPVPARLTTILGTSAATVPSRDAATPDVKRDEQRPGGARPERDREGHAMKFGLGLVIGIVIGVFAGVAAVVAFAVQSDQDVREVFAKARKNIETIDIDAVGAQVQETIADVQTQVADSLAKAKDKAEQASSNGADAIEAAAEAEPVANA
jgi:gas vesicle protein